MNWTGGGICALLACNYFAQRVGQWEASTECWPPGAGALGGGLLGGRPGRVAPAKGVCVELALIGLASSGGGSAVLCKL